MSLTKVTNSMIAGVTVGAYDLMTPAQIASAQAGTLPAATAVSIVQEAVDIVYAKGGGQVIVQQGVYMGSSFYTLNLYHTTNPVVPIIVVDQSRSDHLNYYVNSNDAEYSFMGSTPLTGGPNSPIIRIHNFGLDGLRNPSIFFSYGTPPDASTLTTPTTLGWVIGGSNDGNAHSNVPAHDFVLAGGQGASYTVGTAAVNASSAVVTGTSTAWTSDFVGAIFTVDSQSNAAGIVKSVESNTSLTLESIWSTYGGTTASAGAYQLQGGNIFGTLTSDYRARLVLGQNYTWLLNSGNYSGGEDYDPLAVANGTGNYPANLSYVLNGNRLIGGALNPSTLVKIDNATGTPGLLGFVITGGAYSGTPTRCMYIDKATNTFYITNALNGAGGISMGADGVVNFTQGFTVQQKTSAEIGSVANAINTTTKFVGKQIWNSTTNVPLWAQGALANSPWVDGAGSVIITPA